MIIDSIEFFDQNEIENRFNKLVTEIALKLESTYYEKVSKFCYCYRRSFWRKYSARKAIARNIQKFETK